MKTVNSENIQDVKKLFSDIIDVGLEFKLQNDFLHKTITLEEGLNLITPLENQGQDLDAILDEFCTNVLPFCSNFSSPNFMGFPDAGNSIASIAGSMLYNLLQQNIVNHSFCSPSATFIEIGVIQWLRNIAGYTQHEINDIWDVGGLVTHGGTSSNTIAMLLARENKFPGTMERGITDPDKCNLVVPFGIGHYSVKSGQMWLGCGNHLIEVKTKSFKYDLDDLKKKLDLHSSDVMCVVAYAGDARTTTFDDFKAIHDIVKSYNKDIWLHADACQGFSVLFNEELKNKAAGIQLFDSISLDPHKQMLTPYDISVILVKDPKKLKLLTSIAEILMSEPFSFSQATPFIGSKPWISLKLWFMMKNYGKEGLSELARRRHEMAIFLESQLSSDKSFLLINKVIYNSVVFMFTGNKDIDINSLNDLNKKIHKRLLKDGIYHLHHFSIYDAGVINEGAILFPLRFMSGNPNINHSHIIEMIAYIKSIGNEIINE